ncbi:hypothetical protein FA037_05585 [Bacillus amyloliquefaciens]|uniref:hypothetical protein n=1 Tax=Bacillus amyloliquefaciens TaxID=1390 RepID=UPI0010AC7DC0|nr:hypothetical protein [Bacillus amyloliquefaciens]TJZ71391.1 hypothetical protein FA037_05585 [Bacillus amyloliquefaciens]
MADKRVSTDFIVDEKGSAKDVRKAAGEINVKVSVEVSEAITGLKALQREAKAATQALAELREEQAKRKGAPSTVHEEYIKNVKRLAGDWYSEEFRLANDIIYGAYSSGAEGDIYVGRAMGTSTSVRALEATFKDVVYLTRETQRNAPNLNGKVVFVDPGVSVPRGQRIKRLLKVSCVDGNGVPC